MVIDVIVNTKTKSGNAFSYLVPKNLEEVIKVGQLVLIPFGPRKITGIVSSLTNLSNWSNLTHLKSIEAVVDPTPVLDPAHLELAQFISDYYLCDLSQALFLMLPRKLCTGKKNIRAIKEENYSQEFELPKHFTPEQQNVFEQISASLFVIPAQVEDSRLYVGTGIQKQKNNPSPQPSPSRGEGEIRKHLLFGVTGSGKTEIYLAAAKLAQSQNKQTILLVPEIAITAQVVKFFETAFGNRMAVYHSQLTEGQKLNIWQKCKNGEIDLIIGPRSALFMPLDRIGLLILDEEQDSSYKSDQTPRYHARMVAEKLAELSDATLILGSATPSIETFYKTQQGELRLLELKERYRSFERAQSTVNRAQSPSQPSPFQGEGKGGGTIPAPPSVIPAEAGIQQQKNIPLSIYSTEMPSVTIVDLRNEFHLGNKSVLSETLQKEINKVLENKRQTFLFMNRRGAATFILCRDCGHVELCPKCEIPLTLHLSSPISYKLKAISYLLCHHCSTRYPSPVICPKCQSLNIRFFGTGTQKIEAEAKKLFPKAKISRLDLDTQTKPEIIYEKIKNADIVIGTQLIAKNWDLPRVDLVGIISADVGLNLPDFRSAENTFQTLTQVSGRAGRRENSGKVIIQTYNPENSIIQSAAKQDYVEFYNREIESRKKFNYPPFSHLIRLVISHEDQSQAKELAERIYSQLENSLTHSPTLNPDVPICSATSEAGIPISRSEHRDSKLETSLSVPFYSKLHNKFRFQIVIKSYKLSALRVYRLEESETISYKLKKILSEFSAASLDIDPISLL